MWLSIIATIVICALIYKLFLSDSNKDFWKKHGIFEIDISPAVKPYEVLLGWKTLFAGDDYAYAQMGPSQQYCGIMESGRPMLLVKDLDLVKKILIKDFDHFVDRRNFFNEADGIGRFMLPSLNGDEWKGVRSSVSPTFTTGKIRRMMDIFNSVGKEWVEHFTGKAKSSENGALTIDAVFAVNQYTLDVIASAVFGMNAGTIKNPNSVFSIYANRLTAVRKIQMIRFALRIRFPRFSTLFGIKLLDMNAMDFFENILDQALKERLSGNIKRNDFLQLLSEAKKGELKGVGTDELSQFEKDAQITSSEKKQYLTDEVMNAQSIVFFFAGFSTTSNLITFSLYALALHQDIQTRLRAEVKTIFKEDGSLDYDDLGRLVYLDMVVSEVLRQFSASARLERLCVKDYKDEESGLTVPKGVIVSIPLNALHHDKRFYHNPTQFDPEHFSPERKAERSPYAYMPFGLGPRNCIGMRFALVEGKAAIAHMVHHFRIEPTPKTPTPLQGVPFGLMYVPPKQLELKLTPIIN